MAEVFNNRNLLFYNGNIYTQDSSYPFCKAIAILNGRISWLGMDSDLYKIPTDKYHIVDLKGKMLIPSFTDAHMHFSFWAWSLGQVELSGCRSYEETLGQIKKSASELKKGEWLVGKGWLSEQWKIPRQPHKDDLDRILPDNPAVILSRDQHAVWVNSLVLKKIKLEENATEIREGEIERDKKGILTGILKEGASSLVYRILPYPSGNRAFQLLCKAQEQAHKLGITALGNFDKTDGFEKIQSYHGKYGLRLRVGQYIPSDHLDELIKVGIKNGFGDHNLSIRGIKFFADGALGSQTAFMFKPYRDRKDNYGLSMHSEEELTNLVKKCVKAGLSAAIHAIGDRANFMALEAILSAGKAVKTVRSRIEHCQVLRQEDIARFGENGIVASVQPCHMPLDIDMIHKYWGKRGRYSYSFRSLLNSGATLAFGSDVPIEQPDPLRNIYLAVTRKPETAGHAFYPSEKINIAEAILAHTFGGAYSLGMENLMGTLRIGNYADIVILDKDLYNIAPEEIPNVNVLATLLEGEFVYGKDRFNEW